MFNFTVANPNLPCQIQIHEIKFKFTTSNSNSLRQFQIHHSKFKFTTANSQWQIQCSKFKFKFITSKKKFTTANSTPGFNLTQQIPGHLVNSYSLRQIQIHYVKFKFRKANQIFNSPHQIQFHHGKFKFSKAISNSLRPGFYVGFFVLREVNPEKNFEPRGGEKNVFRPSRGSGACSPGNWLKSHFWTLVTFTDSLKSLSKKIFI